MSAFCASMEEGLTQSDESGQANYELHGLTFTDSSPKRARRDQVLKNPKTLPGLCRQPRLSAYVLALVQMQWPYQLPLETLPFRLSPLARRDCALGL